MAAGYDNTTWFYERLSKLVFGQAQVKAQEHFLKHIEPHSSILVIGGGTGQILESISRLYSSRLNIAYVEISPKMVALSRKRNTGQNKVTYITQNIQQVTFEQHFDVVITAFLFDNFSAENLAEVFPLIDAQLKPAGIWLNADFQLTGPLWQKAMLKSMYAFFKLFKAVEVMRLPDVNSVFKSHGYSVAGEQTFYGNFIMSRLYKKSS